MGAMCKVSPLALNIPMIRKWPLISAIHQQISLCIKSILVEKLIWERREDLSCLVCTEEVSTSFRRRTELTLTWSAEFWIFFRSILALKREREARESKLPLIFSHSSFSLFTPLPLFHLSSLPKNKGQFFEKKPQLKNKFKNRPPQKVFSEIDLCHVTSVSRRFGSSVWHWRWR